MAMRVSIPRKLLVLVAALVFAAPGSASAAQVYPDSPGDAPGGAPDLVSVTVSHKLAGLITFQVQYANRGILAGEDLLVAAIDSDQNKSTGDSYDGTDYEIEVQGGHPTMAYIFRWDQNTTNVGVPVLWSNQTLTFSMPKALIGSPTTAFDFYLMSHTGGQMTFDNVEFLPHMAFVGETLTYSLATEIAQIQLPKATTTVKAGRVFSVAGSTVKLTTDEVFAPDTLSAKATVGGKLVKPRPNGLSWKVPKNAKGKKLVVTMTATYQGMTTTQKVVVRVVK
jgi:hypothetical protein